MPRKPRIDIPGYYHIINRGVERRVVYGEAEDYEYFIELLCVHAKNYQYRGQVMPMLLKVILL